MYLSLPLIAALGPLASSFVILPEAEIFASANQPALAPLHKSPLQSPLSSSDGDDTPLPVVIWHGLGDSADAEGIADIMKLIDSIHPGTYVRAISMGSNDRSASFFGNVTEQIETVCQDLAADKILSTAPAIDAVGFSQGGQFLRGYIERCGHKAPPVRSLITFGSQHNGISEFQGCKTTDWVCQSANALLKSGSVWSEFIQGRLVPAQYYRNVDDWENFLEFSNFLADVNNERSVKNPLYKANLAKLSSFVMVVFGQDKTAIPKESGWFSEVNMTKTDEAKRVTRLQDRKIYEEDWIGLKKLDQKGALVFEEVEGEHMQLKDKDLKRLFGKYFGPLRKGDGLVGGGEEREEL